MAYIAKMMNLEFDDDLTCIFNDNNAEKLIPRIHIMNEEGPKGESQDQNSEDDVFLKKFKVTCLQNWLSGEFQILIKFLPSMEKSTSLKRMMDLSLRQNGFQIHKVSICQL